MSRLDDIMAFESMGGEHEFFKKDKALEKFQSIKSQDADQWLKLNSSGSQVGHTEFVSSRNSLVSSTMVREDSQRQSQQDGHDFEDTEEEEGIALLQERKSAQAKPSKVEQAAAAAPQVSEKSKPKKTRKKRKRRVSIEEMTHAEQLCHEFGLVLFRPPSPKPAKPQMKVIEVIERKQLCALCEQHFKPQCLETQQMRASVCELRRFFRQHQAGETERLVRSGEEDNETYTIDPKYKYSRLYDRVKVCKFCEQFFPCESYKESVIARIKAKISAESLKVELEREALKRSGYIGKDDEDGNASAEKPAQCSIKSGEENMPETSALTTPIRKSQAKTLGVPSLEESRCESPDVPMMKIGQPNIQAKVALREARRRAGANQIMRSEKELKQLAEVKELRSLIRALQLQVTGRGKKRKQVRDRVDNFLSKTSSLECADKVWLPIGLSGASNDNTTLAENRSALSPHRPAGPRKEALGRPPTMTASYRRKPVSLRSQVERELCKLHCSAAEHDDRMGHLDLVEFY